MAIKILITLEGSEEVRSAIDGIAKRGEDMMRGFQDLGTGATQPFGELSDKIQTLGPSFESTTRVSHGFAESLRVVIPALRLAGVEVGNFAGFSRLASAGLAGLAAAVTGAVIVAFANLEEQAKKTKAGLTGLFGSREVGGQAFSLLEQSAKELGISVDSLAPAFQSATTAFNRFQQTAQKFKFVAINPKDLPIGNIEKTAEAVANLFKIIRAGGQDEAEASKSAKAFFDTLKEGGRITTQVLDQLPEGAIRLLGQALGTGAQSVEQLRVELALTAPSITKVIEALARFGPQAKAAFDADAVKGFRDELNKIMREFTTEFRELMGISFSDFIVDEIRKFARDIRAIIEDFRRLRDAITKIASPQAATGIREEAKAEAEKLKAVQPFKLSDLFKFDTSDAQKALDELKSKSGDTAQSVWAGWSSFNDRFSKMSNDVVLAGNAMLLSWQQLEKKSKQSGQWFSPPAPGTNPFAAQPTAAPITAPITPAVTPEQQATQTQNLVTPFQQADDQIRIIWTDLMDYISTALGDVDLSSLTGALVDPFKAAVPLIRDELVKVSNMILEIMRQAATAAGMIQQLNQGGPSGGGSNFVFQEVAGGGYIRGPGTTTSDSIPAWLSNREYVIQAKAVDHYGASLFAALNSMRLPKDLFSHFAVGGLAKALTQSMSRFQTGGAVAASTSGRSLTIVLDGQRFGLNGSADVIDKLERVATMQGIASIGRPPGWVR